MSGQRFSGEREFFREAHRSICARRSANSEVGDISHLRIGIGDSHRTGMQIRDGYLLAVTGTPKYWKDNLEEMGDKLRCLLQATAFKSRLLHLTAENSSARTLGKHNHQEGTPY